MSFPTKEVVELAGNVIQTLLPIVGPAVLRQKIDEWEQWQAAAAPSEIAFRQKFGEPSGVDPRDPDEK